MQIGSLQNITATFQKVHPSRTGYITIRDHVAAFSAIGAPEEIRTVMDGNANAAKSNLLAYTQRRFDSLTQTLIA